MLNKEICWKCALREAAPDKLGYKWARVTLESFDFSWKHGHVYCFGWIDYHYQWLITSNPPENCPFLLEHILQEQKSC